MKEVGGIDMVHYELMKSEKLKDEKIINKYVKEKIDKSRASWFYHLFYV